MAIYWGYENLDQIEGNGITGSPIICPEQLNLILLLKRWKPGGTIKILPSSVRLWAGNNVTTSPSWKSVSFPTFHWQWDPGRPDCMFSKRGHMDDISIGCFLPLKESDTITREGLLLLFSVSPRPYRIASKVIFFYVQSSFK